MKVTMMNFEINENAYRETYIILNKLNLYNRIPEKLRTHIEEKQNIEHEYDFNEKMPLFYQIENIDTKNFLTYLFIKYINTSAEGAENIKESFVDMMKEEYK